MFSFFSSSSSATSKPEDISGSKPAEPTLKLYDPLKGGRGADAYYKEDFTLQPNSSKKLRGSAAAFYGSKAPPSKGFPGADELNAFLKTTRSKFLDPSSTSSFRVVLGNEAADLDSIASAIAYAYFLETITPAESDICNVPLVSIPRLELKLRTDVAWLLPDTGLDIGLLVFTDEIDLKDLYARNKLQLVLVDHNVLASAMQDLQNVIVEIVDHHVPEDRYPWVKDRTLDQVGSCCTLVAEKISEGAAEVLGNVALCRLLLGAILADTANFDSSTKRFDKRDQIMAGLLVSGAGSLGTTDFANLLREKKFDQMELTTGELLRVDYKQWTLGPGTVGKKGEVIQVGIASVGLSLAQLVGKDDNFASIARDFAASHQLHVLVIMSMYLAPGSKKFKRELALLSELDSLNSNLAYWLQHEDRGLKLRAISVKGLPPRALAFTQGTVTASRKQIQPLLAAYFNRGG